MQETVGGKAQIVDTLNRIVVVCGRLVEIWGEMSDQVVMDYPGECYGVADEMRRSNMAAEIRGLYELIKDVNKQARF